MKVDFHTHFIPQQFPDMGEKYGGEGWPTLLHAGPCQADIYHAGKHYRRIDDRSWDPERRLQDMDAEGIDVQVLSPIPVTFAYHFGTGCARTGTTPERGDCERDLCRTDALHWPGNRPTPGSRSCRSRSSSGCDKPGPGWCGDRNPGGRQEPR